MEGGAEPSMFIRIILNRCGGRSRFLADPDDHIDAADRGAGGRRRQIAERDQLARDVLQHAAGFAEEMMMVIHVGIEIAASRLDHDLTQDPAMDELMERVVYC